jgi:serine/threonine protein kinase
VQCLGWYETDETLFLTMEYLPKGDLELYLDRPLPELEVKQIMRQVLQALTMMHGNNVAHRDLKPSVSSLI